MIKAIKNFFNGIVKGIETSRTKQVERYLAQSQNLVELERRMKEIDNLRSRHYI